MVSISRLLEAMGDFILRTVDKAEGNATHFRKKISPATTWKLGMALMVAQLWRTASVMSR